MNTLTLKTFLVAALFALMATGGTIAQAAALEGFLQGSSCVVVEKLCATDWMDPRLAAEKSFVLVDKNGTYYFISNVDASILAGNLFNQARITGDVNNKNKAVTAEKLEIFSNGGWHEVWSMQMQNEEIQNYNIGT
jgi:hypothetical protein